ncbi:MAG: DUF4381 domain-containing protein [Verrucomicrobiota bacterium]
MSEDPANLQNLHDVVPPPEVSWWPLAPGWYVLGFVALVTFLWLSWVSWKRWRGNAYRRAALEALEGATNSVEVAEVLRRTALAISSRPEIAMRTGDDWIEWLESTFPGNLSEEVRKQLTGDLYRPQSDPTSSDSLRTFASEWIRDHSILPPTA